MLIEFTLSNYRSIKGSQTLSFAATKDKELQDSNTFETAVKALPRLVCSALIYGPNASGKSNLIEGLYMFQHFVENSATKYQAGEKIPVVPFRLSKDTKSEPSTFEAIFIEDNVRYEYGFSATSKRIVREWLYAYPSARAQKWFEREYNHKKQNYDWYIGPGFRGGAEIFKKSTRSNALFLSTAIQLNNEQLRPVYQWFSDRLAIVRSHRQLPESFEKFTVKQCQDDKLKKRILGFMKAADLGIDDVSVETRFFNENDIPTELDKDIRTIFEKKLVGQEIPEVFTRHISQDGESVDFELSDESDGTQKLFALAGPLLDVLDNGLVLVMDELDIRLHPYLTQLLIESFHNKDMNKNNAQLLCTTHNTSLLRLDIKLFRRDQIWFTVKGRDKSTQLVPLSDFKIRKGEALERAYLRGRYGAVPFISKLNL